MDKNDPSAKMSFKIATMSYLCFHLRIEFMFGNIYTNNFPLNNLTWILSKRALTCHSFSGENSPLNSGDIRQCVFAQAMVTLERGSKMFSHVPATLPNEQQSPWRNAKANDHAHLQPSENSLFLKKCYRLLPVYFERIESRPRVQRYAGCNMTSENS